jgi:hypothetical protein
MTHIASFVYNAIMAVELPKIETQLMDLMDRIEDRVGLDAIQIVLDTSGRPPLFVGASEILETMQGMQEQELSLQSVRRLRRLGSLDFNF